MTVVKPPLGLTPNFIVNRERMKEINEAIDRFQEAGCIIPIEWVEELNDLIRQEDSASKLYDGLKANLHKDYIMPKESMDKLKITNDGVHLNMFDEIIIKALEGFK